MLTRRKLWVLILSLSESFMLSGHYAVFMPFYPNVAHEKGNTASEVGAFFAAGSCVGLITSPLLGLLLKRGFPPKTMVISGMFLSGLLLTVHGFYKDFFKNGGEFFYANLITRIVHSVGPVAATTAIYPIVAVELAEERGTYLPIIEAFYNIGLMIWPSIGAILYAHFGYAFPFVSVGICSLFMCLILMFLLPSPKKTDPEGDKPPGSKCMDFTLLLILANITICYLMIGFNDITLSVELEAFHLSHTQIGYCFAVATVCYGSFIYVWGLVCRSRQGLLWTLAVGYVVSILGLFFCGPCILVSIEPTLLVRLLGQALMGLGLAALFTSSMVRGMSYLQEELNMPDDVSTHGFFSGLLFFSLSVGYLIGHAIFAGFLRDVLSYPMVVLLIILVVMIFSLLSFANMIIFRSSFRSDYQVIDGSNDTSVLPR